MKHTAAVEAFQVNAINARQVAIFAGLHNLIGYVEGECVVVKTASGPAIAGIGDYVVKGISGLAVVKRESFEAMFQPADM